MPPFPFCEEDVGGVRGRFPLDDSDLFVGVRLFSDNSRRVHTMSQDLAYPHGNMTRPQQCSTLGKASSVMSLFDCLQVDLARREKLT